MKLLVVGGAGYIGSHMVKTLATAGHEVVTLDNLSTGYRDAVQYGRFVRGELADRDFLQAFMAGESFDAVFHFASSILVGESMHKPAEYYRNNVVNTLNLLDAMNAAGCTKLVFSFSAAVYGLPERLPIREGQALCPLSPYGKSKAMIESMLEDYQRAYGLHSVCLRYFNAAGADASGLLGERHNPETHLIPLLLQVASGRRQGLTVYGTDYDTQDGTCVRDYVHVEDLCDAHLLALDYLDGGGETSAFNLGSEKGFSVRQVIDVAAAITGRDIRVEFGQRREGDSPVLIADAQLARHILRWRPKKTNLEQIIMDAWRWEQHCCSGL